MEDKYIVVLITTSEFEESKKIADRLVTEKIAACVNIIPQVNSIFWWKNKIETSTESLMIIKTTKNQFKKIIEVVKGIHSYTVPEIIALPIIEGNKEYLEWIDASVNSEQ